MKKKIPSIVPTSGKQIIRNSKFIIIKLALKISSFLWWQWKMMMNGIRKLCLLPEDFCHFWEILISISSWIFFISLSFFWELTSSAINENCGSGSSSGKAYGYGMDGPGSIPGVKGVEIFLRSFMSRLVLGSTQPPIKLIPGAFPGEESGRA